MPMSEMIKISLPDGSVREMPRGSTPADVAAAIGPGLAKAALAAKVDGELVDLHFELVDARLVAEHLIRRAPILLGDGAHASLDGCFHQCAHFQKLSF